MIRSPWHLAKGAVKTVLSTLGLKLQRDRKQCWDLHLYRETATADKASHVNLGAGDFYHPEWLNLDNENDFYALNTNKHDYLSFDLVSQKPLPFASQSLDCVYCSHTIEHLSDEVVLYLFREVNRCLKKSGVFRITCPDMELYYRAYIIKDLEFWPKISPWGTTNDSPEINFLENFATVLTTSDNDQEKVYRHASLVKEIQQKIPTFSPEQFFSYFCTQAPSNSNSIMPEGHCNWFTTSKLINMFQQSGFSRPYRSGFGQSADPKMRNTDIFDSTCPELSLYVEARN
jgi:predicted SAM-dependent methyltransferase